MKIADLLTESQLDEITLGDYHRKAKLKQAGAQMSKAFGHDRSPEKMAQLDREIANRGKGLERAKVRTDKAHAEYEAKRKAEYEELINKKAKELTKRNKDGFGYEVHNVIRIDG